MKRSVGLVVGALVAGALQLGTLSPAAGVGFIEEGTIGGPLHADMYPSGLETAADGSVVVADTGNNQIARYASDGTQLWRVGSFGDGSGEFDNPRDVGVDADNNVYVADTRNSRIVKLSPTGAWLAETSGPATGFSFPLGVSARDGKVYVGDTGRDRVVVLNAANLNVVTEFTANGVCANFDGLRDAQAGFDGSVYIAGYKTNEIFKLAADGTCLLKWGQTGSAPGQFRTPYGVDTEIDPVTGQELVYVADGINNRAQTFTTSGAFVAQFGSYGTPTEVGTFTTMRRVAVARDGSGDVWAADLWGNRVERWQRTAGGYQYAQTIGDPMPAPASDALFHEPRGLAFTPQGKLWVADTVHHGFQQFDTDGSYVSTCGERAAEGSQLGQFNWPRGIAVDPATGDLWTADTKQHQLQVLDSNCQGIGLVKNNVAGTDDRSFNWPYDIAIRPADRFAFVVDTQNHRVKAYDVANATWPVDNKGPLPTHVFGSRGGGWANFMWPSGVTTGPDGHVYVADRGNDRVVELTYDPASGFTRVGQHTAGGTLDGPEGVATDDDDRLYIADSNDGEVVVLGADRTVEATITGLSHPANLAVGPDDKLYVSDTYADVVRVYSVDAGSPPDTTLPAGAVQYPSAGGNVPSGPVTLTGTATDNVGVGSVQVAVKRSATNTWLNGGATWGSFSWLSATVNQPGAASTDWSLTFTPPDNGAYGLMVRVDDLAGNVNDPKPWVSFSVVSAVDTQAPTGAVTSPAGNGTVPLGPATLTGTAADNVGVDNVRVAIRRAATNTWLQPDGSYGGFAWVPATVASPGATSTGWSLPFTPPAVGAYGLQLRVDDQAGNVNSPKPWVSFNVVQGGDSAPPTGSVTAPAQGASVPAPVSLQGDAADDTGVSVVRLGIRQVSTGQWWNGSAWQSQAVKVEAVLSSPGATSTTWSYSLPSGADPGGYGFSTDIVDTAGKLATGPGKPAWRTFTLVG